MRSTKPLLAALLLGLAAQPAMAQQRDLGAAVEQLEGENAVLRIELRALRERLIALEEVMAARAPGEGRPHPWPNAGASAPASADRLDGPSLTRDGANFLLPDVRLADDAGAQTPGELVELLRQALLQIPDAESDRIGHDRVLLETVGRFGAFSDEEGHAFLLPAELWSALSLQSAPARPVLGDLAGTLDALAPATVGARVTSLTVQEQVGNRPAHGPFLGVSASAQGVVTHVYVDSPAAKADLRIGDRVSAVRHGGSQRAIDARSQLGAVLESLPVDAQVVLDVVRDDMTAQIKVHLTPWPDGVKHADMRLGALTRVTVGLSGGEGSGGVSLELLMARVNSRWLIVSARSDWFEAQARKALEQLYRAFRRRPLDEVDADLVQELRRYGLAQATLLDATSLALPFYRVTVQPLANGEFGAVAAPHSRAYPTLITGPFPDEHDPLKNPYVVRERR